MRLLAQVEEIKKRLFSETVKDANPNPTGFALKVASSSKKNPCASSFNIWHANKDNNIGTDSPWGTH